MLEGGLLLKFHSFQSYQSAEQSDEVDGPLPVLIGNSLPEDTAPAKHQKL